MDKRMQRFVDKARDYKTNKFSKMGLFFLKLGITANTMTMIAFLNGLLGVYFLFNNYWWFFIFGALHLITDGLDGVIARASKTTNFGRYFDLSSDCFITFIIFVKAGWFLNDYYIYIVAGLYLIAVIIHFISKLAAPIFFIRTVTLSFLAVVTFPLFPAQTALLTIGYLTAGAFSLYSLALQLKWWLERVKFIK